MKKYCCALILGLFCLSSCTISDNRISRPLSHESLMKKTTDKLSFSFKSRNWAQDLEDWIKRDVPDFAIVKSTAQKNYIDKAHSLLHKMGIECREEENATEDLTIYYEEQEQIDCSKIVEGKGDFGCAASTNMYYMIKGH